MAAASAVVDRGMAVAEAMAEFGIASKPLLQKWRKVCREGGINCGMRSETDCHRYSSCKGIVGKTFGNVPGEASRRTARGRSRAPA